MKKLTVLFLAILVITNISFSQTNTTKSPKREKIFFGLSVGPSFPESDYKNKEFTLNSGYAKVGYKIQAYGGINLIGVLGVSILGFTNYNTTNTENLKNNITSTYPGNNWIDNSKSWQLFGGMGGITLYYPLDKKLTLDVKIMSGLLNAISPELLFVSGSNTYKLESQTTNSFSYMTSIGLNVNVGQNVSLTTSMDFMSSSPSFNNVKTTTSINGVNNETTTSFSREINIINLMVGFRYSIR